MGFLIRKWPLLAAVASLLVALWQIDGVRIRAALRAGPEGGAPWATAALGPASHVATIEARPIAGLDANVSGLTYSRATGTLNKELFLIPGATHIKTYYVPEYVDQAVGKLAEFFGKNL